MAESVAERVMREYPQLSFLLRDPEVGRLLTDAVEREFDPATFQQKLYATNWWRSRSQAQREWEITRHNDPGTANQQRKSYRAQLQALGGQLGISFSSDQLKLFSEMGLGMGIEANDQQMLNHLMKLRVGPQNKRPGTIDNLRHQIRGLANTTYMVPMSTTTADRLAEAVASGNRSMEGIEASLRIQAARMYPHLESHIDRGETMADLTDSYRELIAQELEVDANRVDLFKNPYWNKVINHKPDPQGDTRMMTLQEAMVHARSRPEWWQTSSGKQSASQFSNTLLKMFGKRRGSGGFG